VPLFEEKGGGKVDRQRTNAVLTRPGIRFERQESRNGSRSSKEGVSTS